MAKGEPTPRFAPHVDDLPIEDYLRVSVIRRRSQVLDEGVEGIGGTLPRLPDRPADLQRQGHGIAHGDPFDVGARHGVDAHMGHAAHANADDARQSLGGLVVAGFDDNTLAMFVGHRER